MRAQHLFVVAMAALLATTATQASVEINANPTKNMNCSAGVCAPTAKNAVLNTTDLANMLATSDVKVMTGSGAVTITVSGSFSWTSAHRLTLDANLNVSFRAPVEVAGQGAVTIVTNDGGTDGDLLFFPGAGLDFWDASSELSINGETYLLLNTITQVRQAFAKQHGNYALANNYDAVADKIFKPVKTSFSKKFEGLGHAIQNIRITIGEKGGGLITNVSSSGSIQHLNLADLSVSVCSETSSAGGLVGVNDGLIQFVNISGTIAIKCSYDEAVGLLVGSGSGTIANSSASGNILGTSSSIVNTSVGGLAGDNRYITNSHASVNIQYASDAGGLAGGGSKIFNCYATGNVSGIVAGGLVAWLSGQIDSSFATGSVAGTAEAGGLVGGSSRGDPDTLITNSYSAGNASGSRAGGLIGEKISYLRAVYSLGIPSGDQVGGLIGQDYTGYGTNKHAYWDMDTSGITNPTQGAGNRENDRGVTGLNDVQLKAKLPSGFDPSIWAEKPNINNGYPYLIDNPPPQ